jgi:hypothetical protein
MTKTDPFSIIEIFLRNLGEAEVSEDNVKKAFEHTKSQVLIEEPKKVIKVIDGFFD